MQFFVVFFLLVTVLDISFINAIKVSCKTEENRDVDWYYLYKLPKHHSNAIDSDQSGLQYIYVTSETFAKHSWQRSTVLINETASIPGRTISPLFSHDDVLLIAYNDEVPDGPTDYLNGHTKGIVATDGVHAIWLVHSVPKFPRIPNYTYPFSGENFGQSFLCLTLNATTEIDIVVTQLLYNEPNIYFSRIPPELTGRYPNLEKVIAKEWRSVAPFRSLVEFSTLNGTLFKSFAKGRHFDAEIYKDWIAPTLDTDLLVESWRNGAGKLPSDCSRKDKVYNVAMIDDRKLDIGFKSTMDHSKWAVASEGEDDWICVGDINRAEHQLVRGGGTVCQKNLQLANIYRHIIAGYEKCQVQMAGMSSKRAQ